MIYDVRTRGGAVLPNLGLGTWRMGENHSRRKDEIAALELGLDLGMRLIDTAEMYGNGGAEEVVAEAVAGRRDGVVIVSKVLPVNAGYAGTIAAAGRSLKRLRTEWIDLYLLHWPGPHPLEETLRAFEKLRVDGTVRSYGVSNFDLGEMEACELLPGGSGVVANQVLYNLERRGIERSVLPWCAQRDIAVMAYSPLDQARLRTREGLVEVARRHGVTSYQVAIAWTMRHENVVSIPKATRLDHVRELAAAAEIVLSEDDLRLLEGDYPAPTKDLPLETA